MASPANVLSRPRALALPWQAILSVAVALVAVAILVMAERAQARLAIYWALGLGLGLVLQRGRLCFAGAFRGLAQNVTASAAEATSDNIDRMQHEASDKVQKGGEQMTQMAQDANNYVQEPIH